MGNGSQSPEMWKVCNFWFVVMELACECSRPGCSNTMHSSDSNTLLHERDHAQRPNYSLHQTSAPGTICTCTQEWSMTYWQQAKCDLTCPNPLTKTAVACLGSTQTTQTAWGPCGTWFLLRGRPYDKPIYCKYKNWVTLYFKVSLLQCIYTFKHWVILTNYMYLLYG